MCPPAVGGVELDVVAGAAPHVAFAAEQVFGFVSAVVGNGEFFEGQVHESGLGEVGVEFYGTTAVPNMSLRQ